MQIGETLTRFGVNDSCKHLLVARFDAAADEVRWLPVALCFDSNLVVGPALAYSACCPTAGPFVCPGFSLLVSALEVRDPSYANLIKVLAELRRSAFWPDDTILLGH